MTPTEKAFNHIMESSLFRLNGPEIDLCQAILDLCEAINAEEETDWSLGEGGECTLDSFLVGAYWSLSEWHGGQWSDEYAALCAIGSIFSPGMTSAPGEDDSEYWPYVAVNNYFAKKTTVLKKSSSNTMTRREKQQAKQALYDLARDVAGLLIMALLIVLFSFLR